MFRIMLQAVAHLELLSGLLVEGSEGYECKKGESLLFAPLDNTGHKAGSVCACLNFNMSFQENKHSNVIKNPCNEESSCLLQLWLW